MRSQALFNPLQVRYFRQTLCLLGSKVIKFSAASISRAADRKPETTGPDFLRELMRQQIGSEDVYFNFFLVQLQTDPVKVPVEDPVVI